MSEEQPIQDHYREKMRALASAIDELLNGDERPKKTGFMLLMFDFDCPPDARTNYISNCEREAAINLMKEFIARAEGRISDSESLQ